jgi:hypothetical protein
MTHLRLCRKRSPHVPQSCSYSCSERKQIPLFSTTGRPIWSAEFELNGGIQ